MAEGSSTGSYLYPRLPHEDAMALYASWTTLDTTDVAKMSALSHPKAAPAPTGGRPVPEATLAGVRQGLREVATSAGWPDPLKDEQTFDRPAGTYLFQKMEIVVADAANEGVWNFLSMVVVPEIGIWRFPTRKEERILGRPRNVLRRLWWRAYSLGPDLDWAPPGHLPLGEDEFVGIMERPTIGGDRRTASAVRDALWRTEARAGGLPRSPLARELVRRFRGHLSHVSPAVLSEEELAELLDSIGDVAITELRRRLGRQKAS